MSWSRMVEPQYVGLLVVLLAGHVLGDFLLQNHRLALAKERSLAAMLGHGGLMLAAHLAVIAPVWSWPAAGLMVAVSAFHALSDQVRTRVRGGGSLQAFFIDQTFHAVVVAAAWAVLVGQSGWVAASVSSDWFLWYARGAAVAAAYVFTARGGTTIVRRTLSRYPRIAHEPGGGDEEEYEMGRVIGNLERFVILTLLLFWQWGAVGFVIAAKSIARFPELRDRRDKDFTEYYLIGTLTSVLVAVGTAILLKGVLSCFSQ